LRHLRGFPGPGVCDEDENVGGRGFEQMDELAGVGMDWEVEVLGGIWGLGRWIGWMVGGRRRRT